MQASSMLIVLFVLESSTQLVSSQNNNSNFTIAKPKCIDRCGDIRIPFPFGTSEDCYGHYNFRVTCNYTVSDPPKLFYRNSTIEITHISLDGQIKFMQFIARDCYARNGTSISKNKPWIGLPKYLTVNNTANKFTIVGCDAYALVSGSRLNRKYMTGCTAMCYSESDLIEGSCMGVGCCQTPTPGNVSWVEVEVNSYSNYNDVWEFNNCGYGFVVEEESFNFSRENLTNLMNVVSLPIVVDWAIGNGTCEDAAMNTTGYACLSSNSACYKPENGYGYRCRCKEGYEGNPYLNDGCVGMACFKILFIS
ncbi:hypothetical protein C2S52_008078 [Perilla frutescens var. hirtella]|nr:hypothetical protein C2S52_008078 [Perilla frutescens var. hirtella]